MENHQEVLNKKEAVAAQRLAKHNENIKKYWFHDSVFKSSLGDASSIIIPRIERFIIHTVNRFLPTVSDQKLKAELTNLLHEETSHARVHDAYNAMLKREGYKINLSLKLEDSMFSFLEKFSSPLSNLGVCMCTEFFTLIFAKHTIEQKIFDEEGVDPIGSCVGQKGTRVQAVIDELGGEKVDIIEWNDDVKKFISAALSPAKVLGVELDESQKTALVTVPDDQLSLAIGKRGQNVRLAVKLTGWKIDVVGAGGAQKEQQENGDEEQEENDSERSTMNNKQETENPPAEQADSEQEASDNK